MRKNDFSCCFIIIGKSHNMKCKFIILCSAWPTICFYLLHCRPWYLPHSFPHHSYWFININNDYFIVKYYSADIVENITLYETEMWPLTGKIRDNIRVVEMNFMRRYLQLTRRDKVLNGQICTRIGVTCSITKAPILCLNSQQLATLLYSLYITWNSSFLYPWGVRPSIPIWPGSFYVKNQ